MRFISLVSGKSTFLYWGSDKGRQGFSCIFLLNEERFRTPESSKSRGRNVTILNSVHCFPFVSSVGSEIMTKHGKCQKVWANGVY